MTDEGEQEFSRVGDPRGRVGSRAVAYSAGGVQWSDSGYAVVPGAWWRNGNGWVPAMALAHHLNERFGARYQVVGIKTPKHGWKYTVRIVKRKYAWT